MTVVSAGEVLQVDVFISGGISGSVLFGGSNGPEYFYGETLVVDTQVYAGGGIEVFSGGTAAGTTVFGGGIENVAYGGVADGSVVNSGGVEYDYGVIVGTVLVGGLEVVEDGGIDPGGVASGTVVSGGGEQIVESDAVAYGTVISSGGEQIVESGGALPTFVNSGVAYGTVISSGGLQDVRPGGVANGTIVLSGGEEFVEAGGVANGTVVSNGGSLVVDPGGVASGSVVNSGGSVFLVLTSESGPNVIDGVTIQSGAVVSLAVSGGGSISGLVLNSGGSPYVYGSLTVYSGGVAIDTVLSGGLLEVYSGGATIGTVISGSVENVYYREEDIWSGGAASDTVVDSGGILAVYSGGVTSGTVLSGGEEYMSGGVASGTVMSTGGSLYVGSGAVAYGAVLSAPERLGANGRVDVGGVANGTVVGSGGYLDVAGIATDTVVSSGGILESLIGDVSGSVISSGGMVRLVLTSASGPDVIDGVSIQAGAIVALNVYGDGAISDLVVSSGGTLDADAGGVVRGTVVSSLGYEDVYSGGAASGTVVSSGGEDNVWSGGIASGTAVETGGNEYVASGGIASGTVIGSGGEQLVDFCGVADGSVVSSGGLEYVASGGLADGAVVSGGDIDIIGSANGTVVSSGNIEIAGSANGTVVGSGGTEALFSGSIVTSTTLSNGGTIDVIYLPYVSGGTATVNPTTGVLTVSEGGKTYTQHLAGDYTSALFGLTPGRYGGTDITLVPSQSGTIPITVSSGQTLVVSAGQTYTGVAVLSGGTVEVLSGGTASGTVVSRGGFEDVFSGGIASGSVISSGGRIDLPVTSALIGTPSVIDGVTLQPGALLTLEVYAGGSTSGFVLSSGETEMVSSGGVASGTVVSSGGVEEVFSGGVVNGTVVNVGYEVVFSGGTAANTTLRKFGTIDVTYLPYVSGGTATVNPTTDVLTVSEGSQTYTQQLSGNYTSASFNLSNGLHGGTNITLVGGPGSIYPDPHLTTFDGLYYSFQTVGEFVLVKDTNGGTFQAQARLAAPVGASNYSVITEIGIQVGGDVVTIDSTRSTPVWLDGQAVTFTGSTYALADGLITQTASGYVVSLETGESVAATFNGAHGTGAQTGTTTTSGGLSVTVSLGPNATHNTVEGLLGNYNGNPQDDLMLADRTVEPTNMPTSTLYGVYADSWRVTQATSLLDYASDPTTTATFTDSGYPNTPISVSSFPAAEVAAATQVVEQAGITDPGLQQAAIYDYLVTGNPSLISVEANLQQQGVTTTTQTDFASPPPPPEVGILAAAVSQVETTSGSATATFQVYLTGDTSQTVTVNYTVVAPDSRYFGTSDFGGTLPSATVTLGPGQTSTNVSINLPNSIGDAVSKTLEVQVSAAAPVSVIAPTAQEAIFNSVPVAGVAPVFGVEFANDLSVVPTQNGTSWTFNLGTLTQGQVSNPDALSLAVLNLAGTGADNLAASIVASGDGGLPTSAPSSFANLGPGGMLDIADLAVDTASPGKHSEAFTITPYDTNATGYMKTLPTETVTVTDTITATTGPVLGDAGNTVFWTEGNSPTVIDPGLTISDANSTTLTGATVTISNGLLVGDQLNYTNQNGITGSYDAPTGVLTLSGTASVENYQVALASVSYSTTSTSPSAAGADSVRAIRWQANDSTTTSKTVTSTIDVGEIYHLTTGPDTVHAGAGNDTIIATSGTLSAGDRINGDSGMDTLGLVGTGTFNLTLPAALTNIDMVQAQEGQASYVHNGVTYAGETQIVNLRSSLDAMVDVAPAAVNSGNPNAPTITIVGAANDSSTINLASGNDAVTLGSAQETVNGGGGNNTFYVNSATIGATINGGTGTNLLEVSGGGTIAMGSNIRQIADVLLMGPSTPYDFTANGLAGLLVDDLDTATADTLVAGGSNQILTGGGAGKLTMDAANQTDTLLKDSAAAFNGDTAKDLVNGDMFDITGLGFSATNTSLGFAFNSAADTTTMSVSLSGTQKTAITLLGQYMAADFTLAADTAGTGTLITLTQELNLTMPH